MKLCVGAVTRRVIEEAATAQVPQIIASRRQVDRHGGYTGLDQEELVAIVRRLSDGVTQVVRDHGGPVAGEIILDAADSLEADITAGFDAVHIDVRHVPNDLRVGVLCDLVRIVDGRVPVEVGDERGRTTHNVSLAMIARNAGADIAAVVVQLGGHIHADRQRGFLISPALVPPWRWPWKAHNMDWAGNRQDYDRRIDFYNVAPEFAQVEIDAWLHVMTPADGSRLLELGLESCEWCRWFPGGVGTFLERARCGARYVLETPAARRLTSRYDDGIVRARVRDAILRG